MKRNDERKTYSVYVHKCPDGMVYVGCTSLTPSRRYNGGNGYRTHRDFHEAIEKWGWKNIEHKVVMKCNDMETARLFESIFISSTLQEKSFNIQSRSANTVYQTAYTAEGTFPKFSSTLIVDALGDSADSRMVESYSDFENYKTPILSNCIYIEQLKQKSNMKGKEKQTTLIANFKVIKGVKIETVLDARYMHNCGGYPVCIRLYKDRKYKYFQTDYVMTPTEFVDMNPKDDEQIQKMFKYYCEKVRDMGDAVSCNDIVAIPQYNSTAIIDGTVEKIIWEKISLCTSQSSESRYKYTIDKLNEAFPKGLKAAEVSVGTVSKFKDYMVDSGISSTTINMVLTCLKASINFGIYRGYIKPEQYPFKRTAAEIDKVTLPKSQKRDMQYLSMDEMHRIWEWFMNSKKPNRYIGYFLFSYLHGGMNIADMMFLKFDDFYLKENGFCFRRRKTANKNDFSTILPVSKWTCMLFQRLGITPEKGKYVFAELQCNGSDEDYNKVKASKTNSLNRKLAAVAKELGMDNVSMTTARHTFATIASKNRMPFTMIEQAMGHAQSGVSSHYIGGFTIDEMREDFEKLL